MAACGMVVTTKTGVDLRLLVPLSWHKTSILISLFLPFKLFEEILHQIILACSLFRGDLYGLILSYSHD